MKDEKKMEENYIVKALAELEERQKRLNAELKQAEHELKVAKSIKTSCQIQLKKLYYEILKDEEALMYRLNCGNECNLFIGGAQRIIKAMLGC